MSCAGKSISLEEFNSALKTTECRGPDASKTIELDEGYIGFNRLAIMGLTPEGMQPFELNGNYVVCNGELYCFRSKKAELSRKYTFKSGSDCEIILPLYNEKGVSIFAELDAEFAMIIYDANLKSFLAARDPIGIRPLFYAYNKAGDIMFASEAKNLIGFSTSIKAFPPGHYYLNGEFICYTDIAANHGYVNDDLDMIFANLHTKLRAGIEKRLDADAPLGFLLSGGLDSSIVCAVAAEILKKPIRTFAVGMTEDAIDLKYAKEVANYIRSDHTEIYIDKDLVLSNIENVIRILETYDITTIRASMGMYLICKAIHEQTDVRVLLTGEISDEIFGYKYTDFAPSPEAFQEEAQKRLSELYMYDVLRADRCISANSIEARVPFGDIDFVKYVMSINPAKKINVYNKGKYLLRKAFDNSKYLPDSILYREKAAFSDAVGHSMVDYIKEYAESKYSDAEFEERSSKYGYHAKPFTKESLLYREIFEKFYPGQASLVKDFWMPNKNWENCDVNDPSARVLKNYGASGN
jgi:asparagine synthase (glutamine-hydrolysing)